MNIPGLGELSESGLSRSGRVRARSAGIGVGPARQPVYPAEGTAIHRATQFWGIRNWTWLFRVSCVEHFPLDSFVRGALARVRGGLRMPSQRPVRLR